MFVAGNRPGFADAHFVANLKLILLVVGFVLLRRRNIFTILRVFNKALNQDDNCFLHFVGHYRPS